MSRTGTAPHPQKISLPSDLSHWGVFLPETVCRHCGRGNVDLDNNKCGSSYQNPNRTPINLINFQTITRTPYNQVGNAIIDIMLRKPQKIQPLLHMSHLSTPNNFRGYPVFAKNLNRTNRFINQNPERRVVMTSRNHTTFNRRNKQKDLSKQRVKIAFTQCF
jgi:hypothetical protein